MTERRRGCLAVGVVAAMAALVPCVLAALVAAGIFVAMGDARRDETPGEVASRVRPDATGSPPPGEVASRVEPDATGSPAPGSPRRGGTLRLPGAAPATLDPAHVRDVVSANYVYEIFSGLVSLSPDLEVVPDLAQGWETSPSGDVYTFTLRSGLFFHDGRPLRATDVAFAIERACDPRTGSPVASTYLGDIVGCDEKLSGNAAAVEGIRVVDDRRIALRIDGPKAYFLSKLTYPTSFVVDREQVGDEGWWRRPNGSGPFRLTEFSGDERIVLARNDAYHGDVPLLDEVSFDLRPVTTDTLYENGELDAMPVGATDLERMRDPLNPLSAELVEGPPEMGLSYLGFQTRMPPFDDVHVRRALNFALDKRRLNEVVLRGGAEPADWILPPGMPGHTPEVSPYSFDPAQARAEIARSRYGAADALPPLVLHVSGEGGGDPVAGAIADMIGETLGVTITVEQSPWETYQAEVDQGRYGMYLLGWSADYADPQDFLDVLFHSASPLNHTGYDNPTVDAWLEAARTDADPGERMALYRRAERQILEDAPWVPLYAGVESWLVAPSVRGFTIPALVVPRLGRVWLAGDEP